MLFTSTLLTGCTVNPTETSSPGSIRVAHTDEEHLTLVATHLNGWLPFTADITPYVTPGRNAVLVKSLEQACADLEK